MAVESISNIRTVAQLTKERHFGDEYCKLLDIPYRYVRENCCSFLSFICRNSLKRAHVFGILFGFTDAVRFDILRF